ncbi:hypothetical protein [Agromyces marinus]|uniref:Uncharacterized protein n=1 Tax=Agromyces marinus TaxID=1389020 RepID=A0ABM8H515_9MICO|nr:hypothetical protein [Agromyces marinus]UIP59108.1 hypothetical protein DSM26151_20030 [Agromyces marinus]BDZ55902.1 hypothetical protein GCM10025870_29750 [Agromyces marinus]
MHEQNLPNPWKGVPGFWARVNRIVYPIVGPAQVGIGRPEAPYEPPANPACPLCGGLMADHRIERGDANTRTMLHCPGPTA